VKEELKNGNLNLTQVSMAQSLITKKKEPLSGKEKLELVQACQGKSTRESERFLRERLDLKLEVQPEREKVLDEEHVQLQITLTRKQMEMLEQVKQLLSHKNPNPTWAELLELMADQVLKEKVLPSLAIAPPQITEKQMQARVAPPKLRNYVLKRDGYRCQYVDPKTGRKCSSQHRLEVDHRHPYSKQGKTVLENLQALCKNHNLLKGSWIKSGITPN
jgi:5-methylcytosine-specific restriction endonuclease McrA